MNNTAPLPAFKESAKSGKCPNRQGVTVKNRDLNLEVVKFETLEEAQNSPTPATIFSLYLNGKFVTTDISVCMDSRFDKIIDKATK